MVAVMTAQEKLAERRRNQVVAEDSESPIVIYPRALDYETALTMAGDLAHFFRQSIGVGARVEAFAANGKRHFYAPGWGAMTTTTKTHG